MHPRAGCLSCVRETRCCRAGPRPEAGGLSSGQTSVNLSRKARTFLHIQLELPPKMDASRGGREEPNSVSDICMTLWTRGVLLSAGLWGTGVLLWARARGRPGCSLPLDSRRRNSRFSTWGQFWLERVFCVSKDLVFTVCQSRVLWSFIITADWQVREGMVILLKSLQALNSC